jgi:hypothetical protein
MNGFLCAYTFNLRIFFWRYRKYFCHAEFIHDDISLIRFVIPGLTRNPVFFWIPAGVYPVEERGRNDGLCYD